MKLQNSMTFGEQDTSPFSIEYDRRRGLSASMPRSHYHPEYEIYYLLSGERNYFIKDQSYWVQQGDLIFIDKNVVHKTSDSGVPDHERIVIYVTDRFLDTQYPSHKELLLKAFQAESPLIRFNVQDQLIISGMIAKLLKEMAKQSPGFEIVLQHIFIDLMLFTYRKKESSEYTLQKNKKPIYQKVAEIVRYINEQYHQPLSLVSVSERFYISTFYFSRIFKEVTGFSFIEYINLVRIKEAQRQLRESNLPITKIAENLGFESISNFGKVFKKIMHMSPRTFRKSH